MRFLVQCSTNGGETWGGDGDGSPALPVSVSYSMPNGTAGQWVATANLSGMHNTTYLFRVVGLTLYSTQSPSIVATARLAGCTQTLYPASSAIACLTADMSAANGAYVGLDLVVLSGTGAGADRRIISYVGSNRAARLDSPWSQELLPSPGDPVELITPGDVQDWTTTQPCNTTATGTSCYGAHSVLPQPGNFGHYLRVVRSRSGQAARNIVNYIPALQRILVSPGFPFPIIGGPNDNESTQYELDSYVSITSPQLGPVSLFGQPAAPVRLTALAIYADGVLLQFIPPTACDSGGGIASLPCTAGRYLVQARRTYDSSDLRLPGAQWTDTQVAFLASDTTPSPGSAAGALQYRVRGLSPRSSFDLRMAAGADAVPGYGPFSLSFSVKLTEDPPYTRATLGDMTGLAENMQLNLTFTTPSLTVGPPLVSRFSVQLGPTAAELVDFVDENGTLVTWQRIDVCGRPIDLTRYPSLSPNVTMDLVECRVTIWGLDPATIYYFKVPATVPLIF